MAQRELTSKIKEWLDTPADNRDILAGAELLLRINRNQIFFRNVARNPSAKAARLEYELRKIYNDRLQDFNHEEVVSLMAQVEQINRSRGLDKQPDTSRSDFQRGKRADHEELPQDIQQLWVQNAEIMKKMRDCHTHLRLISTDNSSCPDSDRYPWAKEIVRLDTLLRDNYNNMTITSEALRLSLLRLLKIRDRSLRSVRALLICRKADMLRAKVRSLPIRSENGIPRL